MLSTLHAVTSGCNKGQGSITTYTQIVYLYRTIDMAIKVSVLWKLAGYSVIYTSNAGRHDEQLLYENIDVLWSRIASFYFNSAIKLFHIF